jgi:SulP family sulfate permease
MLTPKLFTTMQTYDGLQFRADLFAGVTVAMVAIPLSLAIAIASGAEPGAGLVTAIVAGFLISALGGSRVQIGGPTGAFIVVVAGVIAAHGYDGLVAATFLAGVILVLAGLLRLGRVIELAPEPVINGFTIGIAAIIATSQLKDLFGMTVAHDSPEFLEKVPALWAARETLNWAALVVGLVTMACIIILRRVAPKWPGLIVAVAAGSALAAVLPGVETLGSRFGALPDRLPMPALPDLSVGRLVELLPSAFVIAFLAGIESLLSAVVADRMVPGARHRPNAEVLRTATNVRAGGRTPVAGMIHAVTVLIVMMLAAPLAGFMAMPALAGLLILTAWNMSEPHKWAGYLREGWPERVLLLLTFVLTLVVDLTVAIGVGVAGGFLLRWVRQRAGPETLDPRDQ